MPDLESARIIPRDEIDALIPRLEQAEGPSRELDGAIEIEVVRRKSLWLDSALEWRWQDARKQRIVVVHHLAGPAGGWMAESKSMVDMDEVPQYTASLDAALTLVPEGWIWNVDSTGLAWTQPKIGWVNSEQAYLDAMCKGQPALALCIAALKARKEELKWTK